MMVSIVLNTSGSSILKGRVTTNAVMFSADDVEKSTSLFPSAIANASGYELTLFTMSDYSGMAMGFDLMAAETVLSLKGRYPDIRLIAVVPFRKQSCRWPSMEKEHYQKIISQADQVIILSEHYFKGCLLRRNDFMLEHSCGVIAFYDGKPYGGTFYTCREAVKKGMDIVNLY